MNKYIAIDLGASGGRLLSGHLSDGRIVCEEVHRFQNEMIKKGSSLCWDLDALYDEIIIGLRKLAARGDKPESVGIDTWGVDFVLLDENDRILGDTVAYRDARTQGMEKYVYDCVDEESLYSGTGIQRMPVNTIFQLMAVKRAGGNYLERAAKLLMIPDYLHYRLTGVIRTEYTNATTTGMINARSKRWDDDIISACGYPGKIFQEIAAPGYALGHLRPEVRDAVGFDCEVILPATHDTASAIMALPSDGESSMYISSGTWSLMGVERPEPDCSGMSRARNFTNEGGYDYRFRYLKNIMGLWMIQSIKKEYRDEYSFSDLSDMASRAEISSIVDCDSERYLSPESMIREIKLDCAGSGQQVPQSPGEVAAVIYRSLARCYHKTAEGLEEITGRTYDAIHIIGGGSRDAYLNRLTALTTGKTVYAGPVEATSIGNLLAQMIASGEISNLREGRDCVRRSFEINTY